MPFMSARRAMAIWGSTEKLEHISEGQFFCLKCTNIRHYKQQRVASYFTLFSIPLIKTKTLDEYVECQNCGSGYEPKILETGSQQMLKMEAISKYSLQRGAPVDEVKSQLIEAGANAEIADVIIKKVLA
jgi:hypothetical protein